MAKCSTTVHCKSYKKGRGREDHLRGPKEIFFLLHYMAAIAVAFMIRPRLLLFSYNFFFTNNARQFHIIRLKMRTKKRKPGDLQLGNFQLQLLDQNGWILDHL